MRFSATTCIAFVAIGSADAFGFSSRTPSFTIQSITSTSLNAAKGFDTNLGGLQDKLLSAPAPAKLSEETPKEKADRERASKKAASDAAKAQASKAKAEAAAAKKDAAAAKKGKSAPAPPAPIAPPPPPEPVKPVAAASKVPAKTNTRQGPVPKAPKTVKEVKKSKVAPKNQLKMPTAPKLPSVSLPKAPKVNLPGLPAPKASDPDILYQTKYVSNL